MLLTRRHLLLLAHSVVFGEFHPLMGLDTVLAKPFHTLYTEASSLRVVFAACAHLLRRQEMPNFRIDL